VFAFGDAAFYGSNGRQKLVFNVAGVVATGTSEGYGLITAAGNVINFGDSKI
jgi:hypothetical protein